MGSLSGTCEIVESEFDSVQPSKTINQTSSKLMIDEKVGKLPMLKTGRDCAIEDDLHHIFDAIDRRTAARSLGQSHQSVTGASSKNASKRPIRVSASQASGIGISESVSLKQALRGLCISHASEMAALKRSSKVMGLSPVSESAALQRLYKSVLVETHGSGLPLDQRKGSLLEVSLVPEESSPNSSDKIHESAQVHKSKSSSSSAQSSPHFAAALRMMTKTTNRRPLDENVTKSTESSGRTPTRKLTQGEKSPSLSSSIPANEEPDLDDIVPALVGREMSHLKAVRKGQSFSSVNSLSSSRIGSTKGSKSASNSPRTLVPVATAKPATTKIRSQDEIGHKSASTTKISKSPSNSPRLVKSVGASVTTAKPKTSKAQSQDELDKDSVVIVDARSKLKLPQKGKPKHSQLPSATNTIKKVLEIEELDPAAEEAGSRTSTPKTARKGELYPAPSLYVSNNSSNVSKSAGNSPRLINPISSPVKFVKKKIKQGATSVSSNSTACSGNDNDASVSGPNKLVCRTNKSNQKNMRKESYSPASSSRSLSAEVNSTNPDSARKCGFDSNSCNGSVIVVKGSAKSRLREKGDISHSSKSSSIGEYSCSTSISEDSSLSGSSFSGTRPHMSTDLRWDAVRLVKMQHGSIGLNNFKLLKRLGCGDIGTVYLAELSGTYCLFALKVMDNEFLASRRKMPRAQTEREILQMLDHPFLPTLYAHFTTDKFSCLVMEYCPGGDLHVLRQKQPNRSFSEPAARFYVAEVLLALEYLHMLGVVYRDLKPENILVREDGHIMLSDFDLSLRCDVSPTLLKASTIVEPAKRLSGPCAESSCIDPFCLQPSWSQVSCFSPRLMPATARARKLKADQASQVSPLPQLVAEPTGARSNSFVGTHEYLAPEIIKGEGHGSAVDWWTFGIFLYELLFGKTPFKGSGNEDTLANVVLQSLRFPESPVVSFQAKDLIRGLLVKDPENRLGSTKGATEIKQHPFFEGLNWALIRCAIPPELPRCEDPVSIAMDHVASPKEEKKCLEYRDNGEHLEFELF